jgi:hypothetical protein
LAWRLVVAGEGDEAAAAGARIEAGDAHLDGDVGVTEDGAGAAGRVAEGALSLGRMVGEQHADALAIQFGERQQGIEDELRVVLARQEDREWVEHEQVDAVVGAELQDEVDQAVPLVRGRDRIERSRQEPGALDIQAVDALVPVGGVLLGDDERLAGMDGAAGELAAAGAAREQEGEECRLAALPDAGEDGGVAPCDIPVPDPLGRA